MTDNPLIDMATAGAILLDDSFMDDLRGLLGITRVQTEDRLIINDPWGTVSGEDIEAAVDAFSKAVSERAIPVRATLATVTDQRLKQDRFAKRDCVEALRSLGRLKIESPVWTYLDGERVWVLYEDENG